MEIILKKDVENLGNADEIVVVKTGYAVNYLIPQGYATLATPSAKKQLAETIRQRAHKVAKLREEAESLAAKLGELALTITVKVSESGKIYGSVGVAQISDALAAQGFEIEKKNISLGAGDIKAPGSYEASVKCYKDILGTVKFDVVSDAKPETAGESAEVKGTSAEVETAEDKTAGEAAEAEQAKVEE